MYKQTDTSCKPKRIRLFALIINCAMIMKNKSRFSQNVYAISDRIWCNKHLKYTNTENIIIMGKVDTFDLMMIITWVIESFDHLNLNGPVEWRFCNIMIILHLTSCHADAHKLSWICTSVTILLRVFCKCPSITVHCTPLFKLHIYIENSILVYNGDINKNCVQ